MSKKKRRKNNEPENDHLPPGCSRCSKCGRAWLSSQMTPHKGDVLCAVCEEEFRMAVAQAAYEVAEAERMIQVERQKHYKMN